VQQTARGQGLRGLYVGAVYEISTGLHDRLSAPLSARSLLPKFANSDSLDSFNQPDSLPE